MRKARRALPTVAAFLAVALVVAAVVWQQRQQTEVAALLSQPCGSPIYKPDGTPWTCTFDDEFDGTSLDPTKWGVQTQFVSGNAHEGFACYVNSPDTISVSDGELHLTLRRMPTMRTCQGLPRPTPYIAGMVSTYQRFSQQYGRFEARMKTEGTREPGLHEAFWLWPDDRYVKIDPPISGEIDIMESYSLYSHLAIPYLHYGATDNDGGIEGVNTAWSCHAERGTWNTYTLTWDRKALVIQVNGKTCLVNTAHPSAFAERYIVDLTAALGEANNSMTRKTPVPATTLVDYVRVWK